MKVDIISGFLGAGKTTLLNKILPQMSGKNVLIENEFGDVMVDGEMIKENLPVYEIYAGCICCSLVADFKESISEILSRFHPDRILIEPSGVGKLSDIVKACKIMREKAGLDLNIDRVITVIDVTVFQEYREEFGSFYLDQIQNANILLFSHMESLPEEQKEEILADVRDLNPLAAIYEKDWYQQTGEEIYSFIESAGLMAIGDIKASRPPESKEFGSWSAKQLGNMEQAELREALEKLCQKQYGQVLRAKGMMRDSQGEIYHFDYTPGHIRIEAAGRETESKVVVIGCALKADQLKQLFKEEG